MATRYVLAVRDLEVTTRYYTEVLGFELDSAPEGWSFLCRGACYLMVGECPDDVDAGELGNHSYFGYINVVGIDSYYASVVERGAKILKKLRDEDWGQREFSVRSPDGHRIMFGETIGTGR